MLYLSKTKNNRGFVALISILVISSIALILSTTAGIAGFGVMDQVLKKEYRTIAKWSAYSCIDLASLEIAHDFFVEILEPVHISKFNCYIDEISGSGSNRKVLVRGVYKGVTHIKSAIVNIFDHNLTTSLEEI
jgi:hypothetical protein